MRIRQHVNPLKSNFFQIDIQPVNLPAGVPVEVELGSAEAHYLMTRAKEDPERFYVGVEIRRDLVTEANETCERKGIHQVRCVFANMSVDLPRIFPAGRVSRFFLNFPDPYFKAKQHKRRVMSPELVAEMSRLLVDGGEVYVNTDIFDLAIDAMATLEGDREPLFSNMREPWTFLRGTSFAARSWRERQCEEEGLHIWRLGYRKL
jgi:tRNA (guanine-N7-)-methyltransferase